MILQVTTLASRKEIFRARSLADLYLNLPTAPYDFLDWSRMRELEQVGYECARPRLNEWLQRNPANSGEIGPIADRV